MLGDGLKLSWLWGSWKINPRATQTYPDGPARHRADQRSRSTKAAKSRPQRQAWRPGKHGLSRWMAVGAGGISASPSAPDLSPQEVGRILPGDEQIPAVASGIWEAKLFGGHLPFLLLPLLLVSAPCFPLGNPPPSRCIQPCPVSQGALLSPAKNSLRPSVQESQFLSREPRGPKTDTVNVTKVIITSWYLDTGSSPRSCPCVWPVAQLSFLAHELTLSLHRY